MCDTIIATADVTRDSVAIFGKNSDREPNEAHHIVRHPAADFTPNSRVRCTHIKFPQAKHTIAVVLAKPFWIDVSLPDLGPDPVSTYDPATLFWRHEILHRSTLHDHENLVATFSSEREFVVEAFAARTKDTAARAKVSAECFARADEAEEKWLARVQSAPFKQSWHHAKAWAGFNKEAKLFLSKNLLSKGGH